MDIPALQQSASTSPTTSNQGVISSDFETFLKMLTAQMENQDPLDPMDSADYATQLATFSGVEQQVLTNDLLQVLSGQFAVSGMADMAAWVGKEARAPVAGYFDGAPITVAPNPASVADRVELVVRDEDGTEVQRSEIPVTADPIDWAGVGPDGTPFPPGLYSFEVISYSGDEVLIEEQAEIYTRVTEVRSEAGETILILEGGAAVLASAVSALRDPSLI